METWQQDSSRMARLCGPLEGQAMPDHAGYGPRLEIADSVDATNSTIRGFLISVLVVLIVVTFVSRPAQIQDDAEASHLNVYDQLEDVASWSSTDHFVSGLWPSVGSADPVGDSLGSRVESVDSLHWASGRSVGLRIFDDRGSTSIEVTGASLNVSNPVWVGLPLAPFSSWIEFKLPHASFNDPLDSGSDNPREGIDETVPTVKVETRLARVTAYWPEDGDHYTRRRMSSTGVSLRDGHCAVDPRVIPYGSTVKIPGVGEFVAVDTGPAVVSRRAARVAGRTADERNALVVDIYCSSRSKARALVASAPQFAVISWYEPETSPQESLAFNR
jgi:3D (Asp-Asp-Asp) domain-containing protein